MTKSTESTKTRTVTTILLPYQEVMNDNALVTVVKDYSYDGELQYEICDITVGINEKVKVYCSKMKRTSVESETSENNYIITWLLGDKER